VSDQTHQTDPDDPAKGPDEPREETPSQPYKDRSNWLRGLFMLLFVVFYNVAEALALLVALFQFLHTLVTGKRNERLLDFGEYLSRYIYDVMAYLTYQTEERPFPFSDLNRG
jgi:hypothetical protein